MAYWNDPCVRILNKYGILVDAEPEVLDQLPGLLPPYDGDMTFHQWKLGTFGDAVEVAVYAPMLPAGNTRMKTLANEWGGEHVKRVLRRRDALARQRKQDELEALQQGLSDAAGEAQVPKALLEAEVDDLDDHLQPSVREFFERELPGVQEDVSIDELLQKMLRFMNDAAGGFARERRRADDLQHRLDEAAAAQRHSVAGHD